MKKSLLIIPITAALMFAGQVMAASDNVNERHYSTDKLQKRLDLTEEQKTDMRALRQQGEQDRLVFRQDINEIEKQLRAVIRDPQWNEQAAKALLVQRYDIKSKLALTRALNKNAMWNNLSEEQQEKLSDQPKRKHHKGEDKKGKNRKAMRRFSPLDLSDAQRQAIATIIKQQRSDNADLIATKKQFKKQQAELIHSENFDNEAWLQLDTQQREIDLTFGLAMAHGRHQIWHQLDEAQQVKMDKMAEKRKEKMKKHAKDRKVRSLG